MMKVYRISKCKYIDDLTGTGASVYSGRWHNKGTHILYTAASPSLAMLETIVHISNVVVDETCLICIELPDVPVMEIPIKTLQDGWFKNPSPENLRFIGDEFIKEKKYFSLKVPSAVMPEESNYLLNPAHSAFSKIKVVYTRTIPIDARLLAGKKS
ncbi:RES family NAD+ phosphorylase [Niabella ginsengisoli]|uniref:RES family NAD+ phosphorylase n=1 Tax=Niabella ginsengisoli TaxID=522298 RepID=A0ABS9SJF6_9BACT|nr:RES family NAD+ phosphorylase [Niabella ginsengisoli]MCH5598513.1 RES family NAD+ phosphorylase [Niabella ginsengisoli]